ncbi:MAG: tetratricopeptide repeat protein [bacterium ADurb.Bin374]|nr:MAG: tetratricopeptide repeat protein [bacterium ADurb.Bin374]
MKGKYLAGTVLGCFFLSLSLFASDERPICSYFEALTLFQQEKFEEGLKKYYKYLLFSDPILSVESRKADLQEAKAYFDAQHRRSPQDPRIRLCLSLYDRIILDWPPACKRLGELLARFQRSAMLYFFKGEYLLAQAKNDEAHTAFQKLQTANGKKLLAFAEFLQKQHGVTADKSERKAVLLRKGLRHLDLFETEDAVRVLRLVMKEFPEEPRAPHELMDLLIRENRLREAEEVLAAWRKRDPDGKQLYFPEARLRFKQERYSEVLKILAPVLSADPGNAYVQFMVAESAFMNGEYGKALELLPALQEADQENIGLLFRRTAALEMTDNAPGAVTLLQEKLEKNPYNIPFNIELGGIYERMGDLQKARSAYLTAINGDPTWGALAQKRFNAMQELKTKGQNNSDTILATMFLGGKATDTEQMEAKEKLPPPSIARILEEQKEILDILSQS